MSDPSDTPEPQRRFLAAGARSVALGGIALYGLGQWRKAERLADDPDCVKLPACSQCVELPHGCALPKAEAFRARNGES